MFEVLLALMFGIGWTEFFLIALFQLVWILLGGYVAQQKRRNMKEGVLLGLLGPFGVLIEALLPTNSLS